MSLFLLLVVIRRGGSKAFTALSVASISLGDLIKLPRSPWLELLFYGVNLSLFFFLFFTLPKEFFENLSWFSLCSIGAPLVATPLHQSKYTYFPLGLCKFQEDQYIEIQPGCKFAGHVRSQKFTDLYVNPGSAKYHQYISWRRLLYFRLPSMLILCIVKWVFVNFFCWLKCDQNLSLRSSRFAILLGFCLFHEIRAESRKVYVNMWHATGITHFCIRINAESY